MAATDRRADRGQCWIQQRLTQKMPDGYSVRRVQSENCFYVMRAGQAEPILSRPEAVVKKWRNTILVFRFLIREWERENGLYDI